MVSHFSFVRRSSPVDEPVKIIVGGSRASPYNSYTRVATCTEMYWSTWYRTGIFYQPQPQP